MKKTLLCMIMALIGMSFTANAEINIAGTYEGTLDVVLHPTGIPDQVIPTMQKDVRLEKEIDGTYTFKLDGFTLDPDEMDPVDISVPGVVATEQPDQSVKLEKTGTTSVTVLEQDAEISLVSGTVNTDNVMDLVLEIDVAEGSIMVDVTFNGTGDMETALVLVRSDKESLKIYSVTKNDIQVEGLTKGAYVIYNATGAMVKSGNLNGSLINVSGLPTGTYFLAVDGASAKFVKQ